ncbi:ArdC family protein [Aerolutibacter ruishenii]|uniref:Antirestriction protein ArdC n=1 Tax=Aerolutibacter ruishenii TaxID=686800 RepID=A0A562LP50_9GAMM|nr:zincin-like metallopeptidase domain-containing protein [Lysobacter ruishenii]TWI09385.1 antirestriction protein ArdC [Lysobacter ruishenii]
MKYADMAQAQAAVLIAEMEKGHSFLPFLKPGDPALVNGLPYNPTTGKPYRGGNMVMLWIAGMVDGYEDRRWLTYKQAQAIGAQVRKGAKSVPLRYVIFPDKEEGQGVIMSSKPRPFFFNVFNAEQIDGMPAAPSREALAPEQRNAQCEALLRGSGAEIVHGTASPHYAPGSDRIGLPHPERFVSYEAYLATALHELAHWTGHPSRLNRDLSGAFGSLSYAREEMVAETASHILAVELGIGHDVSQHAAYLSMWIKIAQEEPGYLYQAAASAEKVCDFLEIERYRHAPLVVEPEQALAPEALPVPVVRSMPEMGISF